MAMMYVKNVLRMVYAQIVNRRIKMKRCEKHTNTKCPMPCPVCLIEERKHLQADNERMRIVLSELEDDFIFRGEFWDKPETETLKEWLQKVRQALKASERKG